MQAKGLKEFPNKKKVKILKVLDINSRTKFEIIMYMGTDYILGRGSFGQVCLARRKFEGEDSEKERKNLNEVAFFHVNNLFVVKQIFRKQPLSQRQLQMYKNEVTNLALITQTGNNTDHLVKVYPSQFITENNFYLVMEYCDGKSLQDLFDDYRKLKKGTGLPLFSFFEACQIILDLVDGYECLRKNSIMQEDIKPQNIFRKDKKFKYGDFGLSHRIQRKKKQLRGGTMWYNAIQKYYPQNQQVLDHKSDIFALGIIFYEIIFGIHPYKDSYLYEAAKKEIVEELKIDRNQQEKQKRQIQIRAYERALRKNGIKVVPSNIKCEPIYMQKLNSLIRLTIQMCSIDKENRPEFQNIRIRIDGLHLQKLLDRDDLFHDLQKIKRPHISTSLNNLVCSNVSQVIQDPVCLQMLQKKYPNSIRLFENERVRQIKLHTESLNDQVRLLGQIAFLLHNQNYEEEKEEWDNAFLAAMINQYLCVSCKKQLQFVKAYFQQMTQQQKVEYYSNALQYMEIAIKKNQEYLQTQNFLDTETVLDKELRQKICQHIKQELDNLLLGKDFSIVLLKLLIYRVLFSYNESEENDRSNQQRQIENCRDLFNLTVLQNQITIEDTAKMLEFYGFASVISIE